HLLQHEYNRRRVFGSVLPTYLLQCSQVRNCLRFGRKWPYRKVCRVDYSESTNWPVNGSISIACKALGIPPITLTARLLRKFSAAESNHFEKPGRSPTPAKLGLARTGRVRLFDRCCAQTPSEQGPAMKLRQTGNARPNEVYGHG